MTTDAQHWLPITTPRLALRDIVAGDFDAIHAYACDPDVARYMGWGPNTPEDTRAHLDRVLTAQVQWPRFDFNLAIEHAGRAAGSIGLHLHDGPNRTASIGWCLNRAFWNQGLTTEAARALIGVAFGTLGLHRVFATCDVRNAASFAVMEKLGMRREGHMRLDREIKGAWRDTFLYAVLASEWVGAADVAAVNAACREA